MDWEGLANKIAGEIAIDRQSKMAYSTDASIYKKTPLGVVFPRNANDISEVVKFANAHGIHLIPTAAGTSLAGQCVGDGLIVDTGTHLNGILDINLDEEWVEVEPGVIRNELNRHLKPYGYFFGPNTSTASRCMMGGMLGNNSSGTTSIKYGVTRDKVIRVETVLHDGSIAVFEERNRNEIDELIKSQTTEGNIYKGLMAMLSPIDVR